MNQKIKLLRVALDGEEFPHFSMSKGLQEVFDIVDTIWWQKYSYVQVNEKILAAVELHRPDAVFMQIQRQGVINPETVKVITSLYDIPVFNWTGDVREDIEWYKELGRSGAVTLFTNMTDVLKMNHSIPKGLPAEYFQIGYDDKYYFPVETEKWNNIVFCGNYYPHLHFPLTQMRIEAVQALKQAFDSKFNLYGSAEWKKLILHPECVADNAGEAELYNRCAIAVSISHFDYSRYYSDRLLRELACGAFVLSHRFTDCELEFKDGEHLVYFDDVEDLVNKCSFYMDHPEIRSRIGKNAASYVKERYTWSARAKELETIISKYLKITK